MSDQARIAAGVVLASLIFYAVLWCGPAEAQSVWRYPDGGVEAVDVERAQLTAKGRDGGVLVQGGAWTSEDSIITTAQRIRKLEGELAACKTRQKSSAEQQPGLAGVIGTCALCAAAGAGVTRLGCRQ